MGLELDVLKCQNGVFWKKDLKSTELIVQHVVLSDCDVRQVMVRGEMDLKLNNFVRTAEIDYRATGLDTYHVHAYVREVDCHRLQRQSRR